MILERKSSLNKTKNFNEKILHFRNLEKSDGLEYECRGYSEGTAFAIAYVNLIVIGKIFFIERSYSFI